MAIVFPASPSVNETFTAGSITYKWDGSKWIGLGVTPADRLIEGSNSLEIDANNDLKWIGDQLIVGDFPPVDDRNGGGIHIRHSNGISFKSNSGQSVSRNWRIRGDDWGWGNLDFGVGDSVSDWSDTAADNVLSLTSTRRVGIRNTNPARRLSITGVDGDFIELKHEARTGIHYIEHSGVNSETLAFLQNDGSTTNATARIGRGFTSFYRTFDSGVTDTEVLYIDGVGNVGIGTGQSASNARLEVRTTSGTSEVFRVEGSYTAGNQVVLQRWQRAGGAVSSRMMYNDATTSMRFGTATSHSLQYETNGQERFRVTNVGDIYFGESAGYSGSAWAKTTGISTMAWYRDPDGTAAGALAVANNANTGYSNLYLNKYDWQSGDDNRWISFYLNGSIVEAIRYNGSQIVYNTGSDYRLKENVTEFSNAAEKVNQLRVCEFDWVDNPNSTRTVGFLAHELQEVFPQAVSGTKDATRTDEEGNEIPDYQGVDYGKLTPLLAAALQEALAEIETLKGRLDAAGL